MNERLLALLRLVGCTAFVAVVWGVVLPRVSQQSSINRRLEWLAEERIDPSAMYYTELERMDEWMPDGVK